MSEASAEIAHPLPAGARLPDTTVVRVWRPRPWIAAALNLLTWGFGALYAGRPGRALATFALGHVAVAVGVGLSWVFPWPAGRVALLAAALVLPLTMIAVDGWRTARRAAPPDRRIFQHWLVLVSVWVPFAFVVQPWIFDAVRGVVHAFRIPSGSMAPAIAQGDVLFAVMRVPDPLLRGTAVVHVDADGMSFVRRVVGLPGDTLEMRRHRLHVNGMAAVEPYANVTDSAEYTADGQFTWQRDYAPSRAVEPRAPTSATWGPLVVPPGHVFLLGDRRDMSLDSRHIGFIPHEWLTGRPAWIYWSRDPDSGAIRWDRLGQDVR